MEEFDDFLSSLLLSNAGGALAEDQNEVPAENQNEAAQSHPPPTDDVKDGKETSEVASKAEGPNSPLIPPANAPAPEVKVPAAITTSEQEQAVGGGDDQPAKEKTEEEEQRTQDPATVPETGTSKNASMSEQIVKQTTSDSEALKRRDLPFCFKNTFDEDFVQNRHKFGLRICSVICFDVLKLGDRVLHRNDSTSAVFPTMKRIPISKQNIRDMYKLEAEKRVYYRKKLNRILKRERLNIKKPKHKTNADKKSSSNKHSRDRENRDHGQSSHAPYKKTAHETSHKARPAEKFSAGGTRILPFERRYNENTQQIKRPKLEELPKTSRVLVGKQGKEKKEVKQPQRAIHDSFRIPKRAGAENHNWHNQRHQPITSTPLASSAPRENLRFERFRQNAPLSRPRWAQDNFKTQVNKGWNFHQPGDVDQESSDGASQEESIKTPPPPISEVEFGPLVEGVTKLLETNSLELNLPPKDLSSDLLTHKCAWWFRTMEKDPVPMEVACPELHDRICQPSIHSGDDLSFLGNVSNGDEDDCQVNEVTSTENLDPAITDEFCGAALISVGSTYRASWEEESFKHIFQVQPGTNYEKENFQVLCTICEDRISGKRRLGAHIRSPKHVQNLKNLSLQIMSAVGKREPITMLAEDKRNHSQSPTDRDGHKSKEKPAHGGKASGDRKKSGRRSRSRSPRRRDPAHHEARPSKHDRSSRRARSRSRDLVEEFLARTNRPRRSRSRSPYKARRRSKSRSPKLLVKSGANEIFHEKLRLTSLGKWDADMERQYKMMEHEEDTLQRKFEVRRKDLEETPESHPSYATEWQDFWQKKYQEVQDLSKDPDDYDYVPEWKEYWSAQGKVLLKLEFNSEIEAVRLKYGMDITSLRRIGRPEQVHDFVPQMVEQAPLLPFVLPPVQVQEDFTARSMSMSISDNGADEPLRDNCPVTVDDIKSTWETLTGQRISQKLPGDSDSSKTASSSKFEFDGFDLVQVLQLVSGLEDQLGTLASKVSDFHRKAEALELTKRRQSYALLQNRDFVALLLQCKNRFARLVAADNLPQKTLKTLNLCIHLLNMILETPSCRGLVSLCVAQSIGREDSGGPTELVSSREKRAIARLLAANLMNSGKHACTEPELEKTVYNIIHSMSKGDSTDGQRCTEPAQAQDAPDTHYDSVNRVVGTALPPLPTINVRAVSPPPARNNSFYIGGNFFSRR